MTQETPKGFSRGLTNYGDPAFSLYLRRSFAKSMGYSSEMLARPVVGIADSKSGFNNCHRHFPELIEAVKRGVIAAGGLPIEFPTTSLGGYGAAMGANFINVGSQRLRENCSQCIGALVICRE